MSGGKGFHSARAGSNQFATIRGDGEIIICTDRDIMHAFEVAEVKRGHLYFPSRDTEGCRQKIPYIWLWPLWRLAELLQNNSVEGFQALNCVNEGPPNSVASLRIHCRRD